MLRPACKRACKLSCLGCSPLPPACLGDDIACVFKAGPSLHPGGARVLPPRDSPVLSACCSERRVCAQAKKRAKVGRADGVGAVPRGAGARDSGSSDSEGDPGVVPLD